MTNLGKLEKITNLRSIWADEARNFTPWLASPENLSQLAVAIGFGVDGLVAEKVEENVGDFFADIIARDGSGGEVGRILIENQFGRTDHDHLGKLLTYTSGVPDVKTVVWISEFFRPEHRAALDWLNRHTGTGVAFFGIEIELWRIGESDPAPRFNVVARPNDWERGIAETVLGGKSTLDKLYVKYWSALGVCLRNRRSPLNPQKALPQNWTNFKIGRSNFVLAAAALGSGCIRAELAMTGLTGNASFEALLPMRGAIDAEYGEGLEWDPMPGRKQTKVSESRDDVDIWDEKGWPEQHNWLAERLERLNRVFRERIRVLDVPDIAEIGPGQSSSSLEEVK